MIDLTLSPVQSELAESVRQVAVQEFPLQEALRAAVEGHAGDFDARRWSRVAELGWFSVSVDDALGGLGLGLAEELLLFVELGRAPASGPLVGTALAAYLCARSGEGSLPKSS